MAFVILLLGFVLEVLWLSSRAVRSLPAERQDQIRIRGLGLPNGSVRALLALLALPIVAAFVVFAFVGDELVPDKETPRHGADRGVRGWGRRRRRPRRRGLRVARPSREPAAAREPGQASDPVVRTRPAPTGSSRWPRRRG